MIPPLYYSYKCYVIRKSSVLWSNSCGKSWKYSVSQIYLIVDLFDCGEPHSVQVIGEKKAKNMKAHDGKVQAHAILVLPASWYF